MDRYRIVCVCDLTELQKFYIDSNAQYSVVSLFGESRNRAVSPVVATILMVAVVVVIAASIGAVSLGFGSELRARTDPIYGSD